MGMYVVRQVALGLFIPWILRLTVEGQGLADRMPDSPPALTGLLWFGWWQHRYLHRLERDAAGAAGG